MKILYFECNMGAAGDMLMASLLEQIEDADAFINKINNIGIPNVNIIAGKTQKCGIIGSHVDVLVNGVTEGDHHKPHENEHEHECQNEHNHSHSHFHSSLGDIEALIDSLKISDKTKKDAKNVYKLIAQAESEVHGRKVTEIHFHEVGAMDAVADIVGVCMLINELAPDRIITSPICVGSGSVHCAHGILPVPAPATEVILRKVPIYSGDISSELCTPTGAALLKYYTDEFSKMPQMIVNKTGYGMGKKDFSAANCVRSVLGETNNSYSKVIEISCNIDDMTAEEIGYAMEKLLSEGALDAYTIPIGMKKSRPAVMLNCMCNEEDREKFLSIIFKNTTTIGVREYECRRHLMSREIVEKATQYGAVHLKNASGYGVSRSKPEYEDIKKIADNNGMSLREVIDKLRQE